MASTIFVMRHSLCFLFSSRCSLDFSLGLGATAACSLILLSDLRTNGSTNLLRLIYISKVQQSNTRIEKEKCVLCY